MARGASAPADPPLVVPAPVAAAVRRLRANGRAALLGPVELRGEASTGADGVVLPAGEVLGVSARSDRGQERHLELRRPTAAAAGGFIGVVARVRDAGLAALLEGGLIQCVAWAQRRQAVTAGGVLRVACAVAAAPAAEDARAAPAAIRAEAAALLRALSDGRRCERPLPAAARRPKPDAGLERAADVVDLVSEDGAGIDCDEEDDGEGVVAGTSAASESLRAMLIGQGSAAPDAPQGQPPAVLTPLHPHQLAGLSWMTARERGVGGWDTHPLYTPFTLPQRLVEAVGAQSVPAGIGPAVVLAAPGVMVRETEAAGSPLVLETRLAQGTEVRVTAVEGRRAQLAHPAGWVTAVARDGTVLVGAVSDPAPVPLPLYGGGTAWLNLGSGEFCAAAPPPPPPARGGILADEMGLGKTLQILSLVANGAPRRPVPEEPPTAAARAEPPTAPAAAAAPEEGAAAAPPAAKRPRVGEAPAPLLRTADGRYLAAMPTLVVAPLSLVGHWRDEAARHFRTGTLRVHCFHGPSRESTGAGLLGFDVVVTTYAILAAEFKRHEQRPGCSPLYGVRWRRVVLDEAHFIREAATGGSVAAAGLDAEARWAVTGTPVQNRIDDMWPLLRFLKVPVYSERRWWAALVSGPLQEAGEGSGMDDMRAKAMSRLQALVRSLMLRREKAGPLSTHLALPPRHQSDVMLDFSADERSFYDTLRGATMTEFDKWIAAGADFKGRGNVLTMLLRLRQACDHPQLVIQSVTDPSAPHLAGFACGADLAGYGRQMARRCAELRRAAAAGRLAGAPGGLGGWERSAKLRQLCADIAALPPGERAVVFSQWTTMLDAVQHALGALRPAPLLIRFDGSMSGPLRDGALANFRAQQRDSGSTVLLVSLRAGGVGLDLSCARHCILLDPWWNPAVEAQALDRVHRVGQTREVFVRRYIVRESTEEGILRVQERKRGVCQSVIGGSRSARLSLDDLRTLFAA